jgi:hypothetical protein
MNIYTHTHALLIESALLMQEWSQIECKTKATGGMEEWAKDHDVCAAATCDWYHGTWQYMRLLGMVAVPDWHRDFYMKSISSLLRIKPNAHILISAAADYGMLAMVHDSIEAAGATPTIVICDICQTPLMSCRWYAHRHMLAIQTRCENLMTGDISDAPFDLIVTDEFLTVLKSEYKPMIAKRWRELLKPGGAVVTVAMQGEVTTPHLRQGYAHRAGQLLENKNGDNWAGRDNGDKSELVKRVVAFADFHTRHMIRHDYEIRDLFAEFDYLSCTRCTTPGECVNPTYSFEIVASLRQ